MKKNINRIISLIIVIPFFVTIISPQPVLANDCIYVDGYKFEILEENGAKIKLMTKTQDGDKAYATYDKKTGVMQMETVEYSSHFMGMGLGKKDITEYEIQVDELNSKNIEATLINKTDDESVEIEKDMNVVEAQEAITVGIGIIFGPALATAFLAAILLLATTVVILGATYYLVSDVISQLRQRQPEKKYYKAVITKGNVYIGAALTTSQAIAYLKASSGNNVFSYNSTYAISACSSISPVAGVVGPEKHGGEGYYKHYHPKKENTSATNHLAQHCFY